MRFLGPWIEHSVNPFTASARPGFILQFAPNFLENAKKNEGATFGSAVGFLFLFATKLEFPLQIYCSLSVIWISRESEIRTNMLPYS